MNTNFYILDQGPVASPSKCGICGYPGSDRKYLDPRKDFEFYGSFIICEACVMAMAQDFGYMEPTRVRQLVLRTKEVESELETLTGLKDTLEIIHDALNRFNSEHHVPDISDLVSSEPEGTEDIVDEPEPTTPELPIDEGSGDIEVDNNYSQPRSNDLLHIAAQLNAGELDI